ncbi:unnamed protein product [Prorocentrum cordatum]|uniref:Aspartyl/asparaginy/proline hydroxylase domain-containing protein n=1 Tax=Prorocentrum cordatum TaxID=2364126 RepID=A0ABN9V0J7_9DINO|nr:unnamed protein product [Polarella glacialis]
MKGLYVRQEAPRLAEDGAWRAEVLERLQSLALLSLGQPSTAIGVGQMLFLYFWWGVQPPPSGDARSRGGAAPRPRGPDVSVAMAAAELHGRSISFSGCDSRATSLESFESKKCPWRWRFLLLFLVELGRKLAVEGHDLAGGARQMRRAEVHLGAMRALPYFSRHQTLLEGPYRTNHNDDFFPEAKHLPIWPREMWPEFAFFLESHAHVFLAELAQLISADVEDEIFRTVQQQQTEFTPLPKDWGLLDLVRQGNATAACPYAPASCRLLQARPEIDGRCFSDRVPNAGVAFARLLPGTEVKPHFATEPRLAVHLGLITPPGPAMKVANETATWSQGEAVVFDDTYFHSVRHEGEEPRFVLLAWICHPCDLSWRSRNGEEWVRDNPLPRWCGPDEKVNVG